MALLCGSVVLGREEPSFWLASEWPIWVLVLSSPCPVPTCDMFVVFWHLIFQPFSIMFIQFLKSFSSFMS